MRRKSVAVFVVSALMAAAVSWLVIQDHQPTEQSGTPEAPGPGVEVREPDGRIQRAEVQLLRAHLGVRLATGIIPRGQLVRIVEDGRVWDLRTDQAGSVYWETGGGAEVTVEAAFLGSKPRLQLQAANESIDKVDYGIAVFTAQAHGLEVVVERPSWMCEQPMRGGVNAVVEGRPWRESEELRGVEGQQLIFELPRGGESVTCYVTLDTRFWRRETTVRGWKTVVFDLRNLLKSSVRVRGVNPAAFGRMVLRMDGQGAPLKLDDSGVAEIVLDPDERDNEWALRVDTAGGDVVQMEPSRSSIFQEDVVVDVFPAEELLALTPMSPTGVDSSSPWSMSFHRNGMSGLTAHAGAVLVTRDAIRLRETFFFRMSDGPVTPHRCDGVVPVERGLAGFYVSQNPGDSTLVFRSAVKPLAGLAIRLEGAGRSATPRRSAPYGWAWTFRGLPSGRYEPIWVLGTGKRSLNLGEVDIGPGESSFYVSPPHLVEGEGRIVGWDQMAPVKRPLRVSFGLTHHEVGEDGRFGLIREEAVHFGDAWMRKRIPPCRGVLEVVEDQANGPVLVEVSDRLVWVELLREGKQVWDSFAIQYWVLGGPDDKPVRLGGAGASPLVPSPRQRVVFPKAVDEHIVGVVWERRGRVRGRLRGVFEAGPGVAGNVVVGCATTRAVVRANGGELPPRLGVLWGWTVGGVGIEVEDAVPLESEDGSTHAILQWPSGVERVKLTTPENEGRWVELGTDRTVAY